MHSLAVPALVLFSLNVLLFLLHQVQGYRPLGCEIERNGEEKLKWSDDISSEVLLLTVADGAEGK